MNVELKSITKLVALILLTIILGFGALVCTYLIPQTCLKNNVVESAYILSEQGVYYNVGLVDTSIDNWSDSDCISDTYNEHRNVLISALDAYQLTEDFADSADGVSCLEATVNGTATVKVDHSYLWHGYRIFLRPLLVFFSISEIRTITYAINLCLFLYLSFLLINRYGVKALSFLIGYCLFNFVMHSMSLLYFVDIFVMLMASLGIYWLQNKERRDLFIYVFALAGTGVCFFGMIIAPLITLGYPLILMTMHSKEKEWRETLRCAIKCIGSWSLGYSITLLSKVIISNILFSSGDGKGQIYKYFGNCNGLIRFKTCVKVAVEAALSNPARLALFLLGVLVLVSYMIKHKINPVKSNRKTLIYWVVALIPCVWIFVFVGHAGHGWTRFNYSFSVFGVLCWLFEAIEGFKRNEQQ